MSNPARLPRRTFPWRGLVQHLLISLRLNFRSRAPLVYGYIVPVFFLLAFGSVFRSGSPPLLREMGQLLTITILGGACFGMPTALVAERDRGVWRRYWLLPASARALIVSASVGRALLVGSAAALQIALAWSLYRTPLPALPGQFLVAFAGVCFAFLGLGLVIAMLAENVPAVQAIGQCVFLPMILIGGVGVPLRALPVWTQRLAGFLPGRYAVETLDTCIRPGGGGLASVPFALGALAVVGAAGYAAGFGLFRWDIGPRRLNLAAKAWITIALGAWVLVGGAAWLRDQRKPAAPAPARRVAVEAPWMQLTEGDLSAVRYDDLPPDEGIYAPLSSTTGGQSAADRAWLQSLSTALRRWGPGAEGSLEQRARNLLGVCAAADLGEDEHEAEIAQVVFERLRELAGGPDLARILAWIALHPNDGHLEWNVAPLGIEPVADEKDMRERSAIYARKFLRRLRAGG